MKKILASDSKIVFLFLTCMLLGYYSKAGNADSVNTVEIHSKGITLACGTSLPGSLTVCDNDSLTISGTVLNGNSGTFSLVSGLGTLIQLTATTARYKPVQGETSFTIQLDNNQEDVCTGGQVTVSATYTVKPAPTTDTVFQTICSGSSVSLSLTSPYASTFAWTIPVPSNGSVTGFTAGSGSIISQVLNNPTPSQQTVLYPVKATFNGCTGPINNLVITVNPIPTVNNVSPSICSNQNPAISLSSPVAGASFSWGAPIPSSGTLSGYSASAGPIISQVLFNTGTASGTVTYPVTANAFGCAGPVQNIVVTVKPNPTVNINSQTICSGISTSVSLSSPVVGATFSWPLPSISGTISGASAGSSALISQLLVNTGTANGTVTYSVTASANGCFGTPQNIVVTVKPQPTVTPASQTICSGTACNVSLFSTVVGSTFSWTLPSASAGIAGFSASSGAVISQALNSSASTPGTVTYPVTASANGCAGPIQNVVVTVNPIPQVNMNSQTICSGSISSLSLTSNVSGANFSWANPTYTGVVSGGSTGSGTSINQLLVNTGTTSGIATYNVTASANSCTGGPQNLDITVVPQPSPAFAGADQSICGSASTMSATGPMSGTGNWTLLTGLGSISVPTNPFTSLSGLGNGSNTFRWTVSNAPCPSVSDDVVITASSPTVAGTTGSDATFCSVTNGGTITLSGQTGTVLKWQSSTDGFASSFDITNTTNTLNYTNVSINTSYRAVVQNGVCLVENSSVTQITVLPSIVVTAGPDQTKCANNSVTPLSGVVLNAPSVLWSTLGSGSFSSTVTTNTVYTPSAADIASGFATIILKGINPPCPNAADTLVVTITPAPTVSAGGSISICDNNPVAGLSATFTGASGVQWNSISGAGTFSNANSASGTYTLDAAEIASSIAALRIVTLGTGSCNAEADTVFVLVNPTPVISPAGPFSVCDGAATSINLTTSSGSISWNASLVSGTVSGFSGGAGAVIAQTLTGAGTIQYNVSATSAFCTSNVESITVNVTAAPNSSLALDDVLDTVCVGIDGSVSVLLSELGIDYQAKNGSVSIGSPIAGTGSTITLPLPYASMNAGTNTIQIQAISPSCASTVFLSNTKTVHASNNVPLAPTIIGNTKICSGSVQLSTPFFSTYSYQWLLSGAAIAGETSNTLSVLVPGDYKVSITDNLNCSALTPPTGVGYGMSIPTITTSSSTANKKVLSCTTSGAPSIQWYAVTPSGNKKINQQSLSTYDSYYDGGYYVEAVYANCAMTSAIYAVSGMSAGSLDRVAIPMDQESILIPIPSYENALVGSPNPASGQCRLLFSEMASEEISVQVISSFGNVVLEKYCSGAEPVALDLTGLATGIYKVVVVGREKTISTSILKE